MAIVIKFTPVLLQLRRYNNPLSDSLIRPFGRMDRRLMLTALLLPSI